MSKILFFSSWYNEANEERRQELITCVQRCLDSPDLDGVYLLCEGNASFPTKHEKLKEIPVSTRPTYEDFFLLANGLSEPGDVLVIGNTDTYPAEGMRSWFEQLQPYQCWALSRWDITESGEAVHLKRKDSQDNWLFISPIKKNIYSKFPLGFCGCDNAIACRIENAGYEISNPSCDVKFYHLHLTGVHNYVQGRDVVPAPYLLLEPTHLGISNPGKYSINWQPTAENPLTPHTKQ